MRAMPDASTIRTRLLTARILRKDDGSAELHAVGLAIVPMSVDRAMAFIEWRLMAFLEAMEASTVSGIVDEAADADNIPMMRRPPGIFQPPLGFGHTIDKCGNQCEVFIVLFVWGVVALRGAFFSARPQAGSAFFIGAWWVIGLCPGAVARLNGE